MHELKININIFTINLFSYRSNVFRPSGQTIVNSIGLYIFSQFEFEFEFYKLTHKNSTQIDA